MNILVIGAGLAGCTMSRLLSDKHQITILEKNNFIGGNCYDYYNEVGILVHKYGPHIFHTSSEEVWTFVNRFAQFNNYINTVLVEVDQQLIPMPINLDSIKLLFENQYEIFYQEIQSLNLSNTSISIDELLGLLQNENNKNIINQIFEKVYKNYTAKMWGIDISQIDPNVIKRVKINLNSVWNYFPNDKYCGLPVEGYTKMITNIIDHPNINVITNCGDIKYHIIDDKLIVNNQIYDKVFYTGSIDELFQYEFSQLPYRSLNLVFENIAIDYFQKVGVINYPNEPCLTRICEYKHLTMQKLNNVTTISKEYPGAYNHDDPKYSIRFYPMNNPDNNAIYQKYLSKAQTIKNLHLIGRLAQYKYWDMDDIIFEVMELHKSLNI